MFPEFIRDRVRDGGDVPRERGSTTHRRAREPAPNVWLFKYLHRRFFRLGAGRDQASSCVSRVATTSRVAEAPESTQRTASDREGGKSFNLAEVKGTVAGGDDAAEKTAPASHRQRGDGLPGVPAAGHPPATMPLVGAAAGGPGNDLTSRTVGGGSLADALPERAARLEDGQTGESVLRPTGNHLR